MANVLSFLEFLDICALFGIHTEMSKLVCYNWLGFQGKSDRVQWLEVLKGNNRTGRMQGDVETE